MKLYCKKCNELLTLDSLKKARTEDLKFVDGEDLLPQGTFIEALEAEYFFGVPIDYLIDSDSINLEDHKEKSRFIGCCGSSQLECLNQICPNCKNEIGIFVSDCFTSTFTGIDIDKVSLKSLE